MFSKKVLVDILAVLTAGSLFSFDFSNINSNSAEYVQADNISSYAKESFYNNQLLEIFMSKQIEEQPIAYPVYTQTITLEDQDVSSILLENLE